MQINRLFEIVYILLEKRSVTAKELTEHFGVSRRTICRDIDTLSIAGIPIYTERGKGGGIRLMPNFVLDKSLLNEKEQNDILCALNSLSNIMNDDTNQVLRKLSTIFNKSNTNWMEVDFTGWSHENDFFNDFKIAILEGRIVEFDYYNSHGDKTFRRVKPIQLWFKSQSWYLKGFCLTKQDMRVYKLQRIKNLIVTEERFSISENLTITDKPILESYKSKEITTIKLRIEPEMAYRVFDEFYESMVEKQPDGSFIVTVSWPEDEWLYGFLLSFGHYIEVLEPKHIREIIKEESLKISKKYL